MPIDDFHHAVLKLDEKVMIGELKKRGFDVDFIGYESKFEGASGRLIRELPKYLN